MMLNYLYMMLKFKSNQRHWRVIMLNSIKIFLCILSCYNYVIIIKPIEAISNTNSLLDLNQNYESKCFNCIRNVSSLLANSDVTKRCENYYCGPYQISYTYWSEAGKPGNNQGGKDFEKCVRDKNCAEQTVRAYFKKFKRDCNNDGLIDCLDMAALHKGGPGSCSSDWFYKSRYWLAFNKTNCMTNTIESLSSGEPGTSEQEQYDSFNLRQQQQQSTKIMKNQTLTSDCLDCICDAVSGCNTSVSNCGSGAVCGPFAISQAYWKDGRRPGASWTACSRTKECSSVTIRNYMEKYKRDCNDDGFITCEDYAAIHRRGPRACTNKDLFKDHYWNKFLSCRANQMPSKDVNMVKVHENSPPDDHLIISQQQQQVSTQKQQQTTTPTPVTTTTSISQLTNQQSMITTLQQASASTIASSMSKSEESNHLKEVQNVDYHQQQAQKHSNNKYEYSQTPSYIDLSSTKMEDNNHKYQRQQPTVKPQQQTINNDYYDTSGKRISNNFQQPISSFQDNNSRYPYHQQTTIFESTRHKQHQFHDYQLPLILVKAPSTSWSTSAPTTVVTTQSPSPTTTTTTTTTTFAPITTTTTTTLSSSTLEANVNDHPTVQQTTKIKQQTTDSMHLIRPAEEPSTILQMPPSNQHQHQHQQQQPSYPTLSLDNNHEESSNVEYPISSEFSNVNGNANGNDRFSGSAFDVVVTNIVGNPDFRKSYPPIPELIPQSGTDSLNKQAESNNNNNEQQPTIKSQHIYNTNHSNSPNSNTNMNKGDQQQQQKNRSSGNDQQRPPSSQQNDSLSSSLPTQGTNNNINNPIHQRSTAQQQQPQSNADTSNNNQQQTGNPLYDISINMTSIFEKSLNETNTRIASECLECICDASSNCDTSVQCISKQREKNRCGLYMISWNQYQESDILLTSLIQTPQGMSEESANEKMYYECTTDRLCAERLIHLYIEKHQKDCNNDGKIDCYDIAAIHRVGPENCNSDKFLGSQYWKDFNICYTTDRLATTTVLPQTLSSSSSSFSSPPSQTSATRMLLYR